MKVSLLGRHLGETSGWDGVPGESIWFYDFQPRAGVALHAGTLSVDEFNGYIGLQDEETGNIKEPKDIVEFLSTIPRDE